MKNYKNFINDNDIGGLPSITPPDPESLEHKAKLCALFLYNIFKIECKQTDKALLNDYIYRNKIQNIDGLFGVRLGVKYIDGILKVDDYIKKINDIKSTINSLNPLEFDYSNGYFFIFFRINNELENFIKSNKAINKFKL